MAEYQNLFTSLQVSGPAHLGVPLGPRNSPRTGQQPWIFHLLGRFGNAQIGPIYLGPLGLASLIFGVPAASSAWRRSTGSTRFTRST